MSTSTKSNFVETAKCLDANFAPLTTVLDFADMFQEENPRFNRALFVAASTKNLRKQLEADLALLDKVCYP